MPSLTTRRRFIGQLGMASLALPLAGQSQDLLKQLGANRKIRFGCSAITWGGNDVLAIEEISSLSFAGIQLRANAYQDFGQRPAELKNLLDRARLDLVMFSSGNADINTGDDEKEILRHVTHARFIKSLGGKFLQVTNSSRPKSGLPSEADLVSYATLLTETGRRVKALGVTLCYHNHMHQLGETPDEVDIILRNSDPAFVHLLLDVAHYQQGGGDPALAIRKYKRRLVALHIKDVRQQGDSKNTQEYIFVELGQGSVNFPAIFKALADTGFNGYAIVELDAVPDKEKTPLTCAKISKAYLESLGFELRRQR